MTTRNPNPELPPDVSSVVNEVNFTTTRAGLTGQLLALTLQMEKPELEVKKTELLQKEEDLKIQIAELEESLLEVCLLVFQIIFLHLYNLLLEKFKSMTFILMSSQDVFFTLFEDIFINQLC